MIVERIGLPSIDVDNTEGHLGVGIDLVVAEPFNGSPRELKRFLGF
jgi:hypothetical protein